MNTKITKIVEIDLTVLPQDVLQSFDSIVGELCRDFNVPLDDAYIEYALVEHERDFKLAACMEFLSNAETLTDEWFFMWEDGEWLEYPNMHWNGE